MKPCQHSGAWGMRAPAQAPAGRSLQHNQRHQKHCDLGNFKTQATEHSVRLHGSRARRLVAPVAAAPSDREDALLLAYYASQNKSLFAAQCFVETVLDSYTRGENVDELQTALQLRNMQQNGELLNPQDQDLLLSWIIMVMLTAKEVGLAQQQQQQQAQVQEQQSSSAGDEQQQQQPAAGISQQYSAQVLGLLQFVKQSTKLYFEEGYSVTQLQSLQAAVASDPEQGRSQFLQVMQQYTRLVMISLEVAATCKLPTERELSNPTSLDSPSGYTAAWSSSSSSSSSSGGAGLVTAAAVARKRDGQRALAVRLLTAFVGGVIGMPYSLRSFISYALEAYERGISAGELYQQLQPAEFLQTGGLVPSLPRPEVQQEVNQTLFGRWLSIVYMAAAQQAAVFPAAAEKSGWAWYGGEDEVQANAMAGFVGKTLERLAADAAEAAGAVDADRPQEDALAARIKSLPDGAARLQEASKQLQQEYQEQGTLRGKEVPAMVRVPDPELEATSSAVLVWRQQVELVQGVYAYMQALQAVA